MFKYIIILIIVAAISYSFVYLRRQQRIESDLLLSPKSFYDLKIKDIDGKDIDFSTFKGKKVMCVNVASFCGNTPEYTNLEKLHKKYEGKLVVLGFPCNQFGAQEPGSPEEIKTFCSTNYKITFPLTEKIDVKGGNQNEVYAWLTKKALNSKEDSEVRWNFQKYLVDEQGNLIGHFAPKMDPMDSAIIAAIEK
jgi:glutathione peroxidase